MPNQPARGGGRRPGGATREAVRRSTRDPLRIHRRRRRRIRRLAIFALILLAALPISLLWDFATGTQEAAELEPSTGEASTILAPLPFQYPNIQDPAEIVHAFGPVKPSEDTPLQTMDYSHVSLPERGQVATSYFADAAFLGDSITEGFIDYGIDLSGALICGYTGISPNSVVNRTAVRHSQRGEEVILDVLAAAGPAKLYVLIGANALSAQGNDAGFLAYYGQMLDALRETLPNAIIYVQALTPVETRMTEKTPGLDNARLQALNKEICRMAYERGMPFLDLYSAFLGEDGTLRDDYSQPDGLHFTTAGYTYWVDYLCRHTVYSAENPWLPGSAYAETAPVALPAAASEEANGGEDAASEG